MVRTTGLVVVLGVGFAAGATVAGDFVASIARGLMALNMAGCADLNAELLLDVSGGVAVVAAAGVLGCEG